MAYALVTGASSGIGLQYATALARDYHYNLMMVSNQEKELCQCAESLSGLYDIQVHTLYIDLAQPTAAQQVFDYCQTNGLDIEVLVNNAGLLIFDAFCNVPPKKIDTLLQVHIVTLTQLCRLFGEAMQQRPANAAGKKGYILNMSSMSAWMTMPSIQCYNASKSYVLNFSKALYYELRPKSVRVLVLTPGSTDTGLLPFSPAFGKFLRAMRITMPAERLVQRALKVLFFRSKKTCMPGAWNYLIVPLISHLPDWLIFAIMRHVPLFRS